jgi:AcrR family transcriptional regulator
MGRKRKEALAGFNKHAILLVANELFLKNGFAGTTMDDIARTADYSKSTLYVYFKSKEDILNHLVYEGVCLAEEKMTALALTHGDDVLSFLFGICHMMVEIHESHPFYFRGITGRIEFNEDKIGADPIIKSIYEKNEEIYKLVIKKMKEGHRQGVIKIGESALETMLAVWFGICGIVEISSQKADYINYKTKKSRSDFLEMAFSLVGRMLDIQ